MSATSTTVAAGPPCSYTLTHKVVPLCACLHTPADITCLPVQPVLVPCSGRIASTNEFGLRYCTITEILHYEKMATGALPLY